MFTKIRNAVLAFAAVAALGTATLVSTTDTADAARRGGFGGFHGGHVGMRHVGGPRVGIRHVGGPRIHVGHRPHFRHVHHRPHWCHWKNGCRAHVRWHRPLIYAAPVVAATTAYAVRPAYTAPRCTCLTKEYTQDGLVVFQDVCTKEVASAPAGNQALAPAPQEQAPPAQP